MPTLRHSLANYISCPVTLLKLSILKLLFPRSLRFKAIERFSPNVVIDVDRKSRIIFDYGVSIHSNSRISANSGGIMTIGKKTSFNVGCIVTCKHSVKIGENVAFGPNVMVFDHNHLVNQNYDLDAKKFTYSEVYVGNNVWIGAGTILLPGTHIGDNCVIAAGSVINKAISNNTVFIQKRQSFYKELTYVDK